ncbi:hypothetical protein B0O95_10257 [Mycetohabitans endofungorum]|uniref:Uncharacterized protein n=1 Tax=Mycetohabitans endofungorum TaxID=417203 RepID=A0A2P5KD78_9BURK|nr:hypothetical protein B0O95_10257 [Mycetohabitans endofungorum]
MAMNCCILTRSNGTSLENQQASTAELTQQQNTPAPAPSYANTTDALRGLLGQAERRRNLASRRGRPFASIDVGRANALWRNARDRHHAASTPEIVETPDDGVSLTLWGQRRNDDYGAPGSSSPDMPPLTHAFTPEFSINAAFQHPPAAQPVSMPSVSPSPPPGTSLFTE